MPGVFQVRVRRGLEDYPAGKSAMIHYGWSMDMRAAVSAFAAAHPDADWLCRHAVDMTPRERHMGLEAAFAALMDGFVRRFGERPRLPVGPG